MLEKISHAPPQDAAQRRRREQLLREQAGAIPLDKLLNQGERLFISQSLQHREPELPGVRRPGVEQTGHEQRQPVENSLRRHGRLRLRSARLRRRRRLHDPLHERLRGGFEHPIELAHARRTPRPPTLERLGEVHDLGGLHHEPQPRQACRQPRQQPLPAPRQHDPFGITATRQRHIEHHSPDKPAPHECQLIPCRLSVTREERREEPADRRLAHPLPSGRSLNHALQPGALQPRRQQPERFARLHRRLDHLFGRGIAVPPQLVEFHGRHARRRRGIATRHRCRRTNKRATQPSHRLPPARDGINLSLRGFRAGHRIDRAPGHRRVREQVADASHKLSGRLDGRHARQRRAATAFQVEHATIDTVIGGVAPDHRLIGRRHTLLAAVIVICLFVGEVVMDAVSVAARSPAITWFTTSCRSRDHVGHTTGIRFDQLDEPAHARSAGVRSIGAGPCHPPSSLPHPDAAGAVDRRTLEQRGPVHEQTHCPIEIPLVKQTIGGPCMRFG